jgi:hypothetical protein
MVFLIPVVEQRAEFQADIQLLHPPPILMPALPAQIHLKNYALHLRSQRPALAKVHQLEIP